MATVDDVLRELRARANADNVAGQARYGIRPSTKILGVPHPQMRAIAKPFRGDHELALALWETEVHEARHVAAMVDDPSKVTKAQMDAWSADFDSWDICDGVSTGLFDRTKHAPDKIKAYSRRKSEFVKRCAFAMVAGMAVHDKAAPDAIFRSFLTLIEDAADDDRTYVKKAVNWGLRQIGKRNAALNRYALASAERIRARGTPSARWIASDALRELRSDAVQRKVRRR